MTPSWDDADELWTLAPNELTLLAGMTGPGRLGCAFQLKFMQAHSRFPERGETPDPRGVAVLSAQLEVPAEHLSGYDGLSRQGQRHRRLIRDYLGFRPTGRRDFEDLARWLVDAILPHDPEARHGRDAALDWCRRQHLEPPARDHLDRLIRSTCRRLQSSGSVRAIIGEFLLGLTDSIVRAVLTLLATIGTVRRVCSHSSVVCSH